MNNIVTEAREPATCLDCSRAIQPPSPETEKSSLPWSGDYLETKANELSSARYRFAAACYYAMLDEGLSWHDIFLPIFSNMEKRVDEEIETAIDALILAVNKHPIPDLKKEFLENSQEYR